MATSSTADSVPDAAAKYSTHATGGTTTGRKHHTASESNIPERTMASGYIALLLATEDIAHAIISIARAKQAPTLINTPRKAR